MTNMFVLPQEKGELFRQMALDEALWINAQEKNVSDTFLRFYRSSEPAFTIGFAERNQSYLESISARNCPWVRRPTGGGTVFHREDLIYSLVFPISVGKGFEKTAESYTMIHKVVREALHTLGVETAMAGRNSSSFEVMHGANCFEQPVCGDLLYQSQKVAGSAQRRSGRYVLHQGSIQMIPVVSHGSSVQPFYDYLETVLVSALEAAFEWKAQYIDFEPEVTRLSDQLLSEKYRNSEWNWKGRSNGLSYVSWQMIRK